MRQFMKMVFLGCALLFSLTACGTGDSPTVQENSGGGAIKNISIGLGSKEGKCLIHTGGRSHTSPWGGDQTAFTESMAEPDMQAGGYQ